MKQERTKINQMRGRLGKRAEDDRREFEARMKEQAATTQVNTQDWPLIEMKIFSTEEAESILDFMSGLKKHQVSELLASQDDRIRQIVREEVTAIVRQTVLEIVGFNKQGIEQAYSEVAATTQEVIGEQEVETDAVAEEQIEEKEIEDKPNYLTPKGKIRWRQEGWTPKEIAFDVFKRHNIPVTGKVKGSVIKEKVSTVLYCNSRQITGLKLSELIKEYQAWAQQQ